MPLRDDERPQEVQYNMKQEQPHNLWYVDLHAICSRNSSWSHQFIKGQLYHHVELKNHHGDSFNPKNIHFSLKCASKDMVRSLNILDAHQRTFWLCKNKWGSLIPALSEHSDTWSLWGLAQYQNRQIPVHAPEFAPHLHKPLHNLHIQTTNVRPSMWGCFQPNPAYT